MPSRTSPTRISIRGAGWKWSPGPSSGRDPVRRAGAAPLTFGGPDTSCVFYGAGQPIDSQVAYRVPGRFTDPRVDRIYVGSGDRLVAVNPSTGTPGWNEAFTTTSLITAGPIAVNYGSKQDPTRFDNVVYVGTEDGTLYALNDSAPSFP